MSETKNSGQTTKGIPRLPLGRETQNETGMGRTALQSAPLKRLTLNSYTLNPYSLTHLTEMRNWLKVTNGPLAADYYSLCVRQTWANTLASFTM